MIHFDRRFARDILRPPPIWFELASERLKKVQNRTIISTYFAPKTFLTFITREGIERPRVLLRQAAVGSGAQQG